MNPEVSKLPPLQQIGWLNVNSSTFYKLAELAATPRNQTLIDAGRIIRVYGEGSDPWESCRPTAALSADREGEAKDVRELVSAGERIGAWLSAAIDDPTVCVEMKRDAPWPDFLGQTIKHGDRLTHPDGIEFVAIRLVGHESEQDAWRAVYDDATVSRLCLQIGDKGRAVLAAALAQAPEVGIPHPLGERHAAIEKALKGQTLLLMGREHVNDKKKPLAEIKFGMSTDLGVLFCLADTEAPIPTDAAPVAAKPVGVEVQRLRECVAFFASVIKSGEQWSDACQYAYDMAIASSGRKE